MSGFFNTALGDAMFYGESSGFFNTAIAPGTINEDMSGLFNRASFDVFNDFIQHDVSGLLNYGSKISGVFSLSNFLSYLFLLP